MLFYRFFWNKSQNLPASWIGVEQNKVQGGVQAVSKVFPAKNFCNCMIPLDNSPFHPFLF